MDSFLKGLAETQADGDAAMAKIKAKMAKATQAKKPSAATLAAWMDEGGAEATDGCWVEPDGHCAHGKPSWILKLGMI